MTMIPQDCNGQSEYDKSILCHDRRRIAVNPPQASRVRAIRARYVYNDKINGILYNSDSRAQEVFG